MSPARVAAERVAKDQHGVHDEDDRAETDVSPVAVLVAERQHRVVRQDQTDDHGHVEEVAVDVLQDQRQARLAGVLAVRLGHGAGRWRQPPRAVVRLAVVVAREPEPAGEGEDQQSRRQGVPVAERSEPEQPGPLRAGRRRQTGRREGGDVRSGQHAQVEHRPEAINQEQEESGERERRSQPPSVGAKSAHPDLRALFPCRALGRCLGHRRPSTLTDSAHAGATAPYCSGRARIWWGTHYDEHIMKCEERHSSSM